MLKRLICLVLVLVLCCASGALALNYSGSQNNEATFETIAETRLSSPAAVANLETNVGKTYVSHPVLDDYPENTTYVYRSANLFGGRAAARLNTNILVFAETAFADKDAAFAYLETLGLIDIIDEAIGSVVLVTPSNGKAFGAADQKYYYALQTAMCAQKASGKVDGQTVSYSDAEYFGGYGYIYLIGIDGGATFVNNYVASTFDYVSRLAGMLLINGKMDRIRKVATLVPAYLVNASDDVIEKYTTANATDAYSLVHGQSIYFNQALPTQKVIVTTAETVDLAATIKDAYYNLFITAMRLPVLAQGLYTASTPYQGYNFDQAPYSLFERNAVIDGVTKDGIYVTRHDEDRFASIVTEASTDRFGTFYPAGEYLQTWFEYLPEEVVNGTAPEGSVPLILTNHGGDDDPRLFVDEAGFLALAGKERIAMVAAEHQYIGTIRYQVLPMLVEYMLDTYPALDRSRVYVAGYSMGSGATLSTLYGNSSLFAAATPMAAINLQMPSEPSDAQLEQYKDIDIPVMVLTSEYDLGSNFRQAQNIIAPNFETLINRFMAANEMPLIEYDFETYPISGFEGDRYTRRTLNNEYTNHTWFMENADGVPMVGLTVTEGLVHALYPEYANLCWNFMKHYTRNPETLAISYTPYID